MKNAKSGAEALKFDKGKHHRRSIRLKNYDYSQGGAYFVTICTFNKECLLGNILDGEMQLSEIGKVVADCWRWLGEQYDYVYLDEWIIMPNHLHGIIVITDESRGGSRTARPKGVKRKPLGRLIGAFKTVSTKCINDIRKTSHMPVWQRNYYEHIIRNEKELNGTREYIVNNTRAQYPQYRASGGALVPDVDMANDRGHNALIYASYSGRLEIVKSEIKPVFQTSS